MFSKPPEFVLISGISHVTDLAVAEDVGAHGGKFHNHERVSFTGKTVDVGVLFFFVN